MDEREKRRLMRIRKRRIQVQIRIGAILLMCLFFILGGLKLLGKGPFDAEYAERDVDKMILEQPDLDVQLLTVNPYSRPTTATTKIQNIVIHYTANPGTTALQNRNYFEGLKDSKSTKASSHFIVGLDGEIVQCVPTWEVAYASNDRNLDTVSIETCHYKEDGKYTEETYDSLVYLTAWLCEKFDLTEKDVIRHYDITGKICPRYFVDDEEAWIEFQKDVKTLLKEK